MSLATVECLPCPRIDAGLVRVTVSAVTVTLALLRRHFHGGLLLLLGLEVFSDSVLTGELFVHSLCQLHDRHTSQLHGGHSIQDCPVGNGVVTPLDLAVLSRLDSVYISLVPESDGHHRGADVYEQGPRQATGQLLEYIPVGSLESVPE